MSPVEPEAAVIMQLMDDRLADAQIIVYQANQIRALKAAVQVQARAIALLAGLLSSDPPGGYTA